MAIIDSHMHLVHSECFEYGYSSVGSVDEGGGHRALCFHGAGYAPYLEFGVW